MPPSSKKRKDAHQTTTLHQFFSPSGAGSTPSKKCKPNPTARNARNQKAVIAVEDVIVIDSDSDVPALKPGNAKVTSGGLSDSDVEIVEILDNRMKLSTLLRSDASRRPQSTNLSTPTSNVINDVPTADAFGATSTYSPFGLPPVLLRSSSPIMDGMRVPVTPLKIEQSNVRVSEEDLSPFGLPPSLLRTSNTPVEHSPFGLPSLLLRHTKSTVNDDDAPFTPPTSLLRLPHDHTLYNSISPTPCSSSVKLEDMLRPLTASAINARSTSQLPPVTLSKYETESYTLPKHEFDFDTGTDAEWGTGDDETAFLEADAESASTYDADEEMDEIAEEPVNANSDGTADACPLCGKLLGSMFLTERQDHVNKCIDSISGVPSPPNLSSKSLVSLSSLPRPPPASSSANAFSVLMTSHKENEAWKEASIAEDRTFKATAGKRRKAPFYKVLQGMPIAVDAFRYGAIPDVKAYFLTHAHSDHYTNLSSNWKHGPIYCSEGTAKLIIHMLAVDPKWVHPLPMDTPCVIPDTSGVQVTLIEANHCPGSCLFFFEGPQTVNAGDSAFKSPFIGSHRTFRYLHCGDFRASPQHVLHPAVKGKRIDHVYLDTTYLDPKYCFPPQPLVISACAELACRIVSGQKSDGSYGKNESIDKWITVDQTSKDRGQNFLHSTSGKVLVVVGTYSIGKERIVKAIAKALDTKVFCDARKTAILRCQCDAELDGLLTTDPLDAGVHVVPLSVITSDRLQTYFERWKGFFSRAVGFRPTGWTYTAPAGTDTMPPISSILTRDQKRTFTHADLRPMRNSTPTIMLYGVPYSEHSSFFELTCFALSCDWIKMIATVNVGSQTSRAKMTRWVDKWEVERKKRRAEGVDKVMGGVVAYRRKDYW